MRAPRVHHAARRCGGGVAARGAGAAGGDAGDRVSQQRRRPPIAAACAAFRRGLNEAGYVEGQNVAIEYRWAEGQYDRLPALAAESGSPPSDRDRCCGGVHTALAAKAATATIPIVFVDRQRPGQARLRRQPQPAGRQCHRRSHLHEPSWRRSGWSCCTSWSREHARLPCSSTRPTQIAEQSVERAAGGALALGLQLNVVQASSEAATSTRPSRASRAERAGALVVGTDPFFFSRREQLVALAARHAMPAIYEWREFAAAGGLMSYGTNLTTRIARSASTPGEFSRARSRPTCRSCSSTKFELVINLKTAKALGLDVPPSLLARADEVIE